MGLPSSGRRHLLPARGEKDTSRVSWLKRDEVDAAYHLLPVKTGRRCGQADEGQPLGTR